jgi:hypothetical protein
LRAMSGARWGDVMGGFDVLFALFSLLLGLAIAEVLGGFARVMKLHARARAGHERDVRVGWLVPLLAGFVLLGQLSYWPIMFAVRERLPLNYVTLVMVTVIVGGYYLFASLVWPDDPAEWPDFDAYYDQHNRFILTGNLILTFLGGVVNNVYGPKVIMPALADPTTLNIAASGLYGALAINIALIFVRGRRLNAVLLATLIVMQLGGSMALVVAVG